MRKQSSFSQNEGVFFNLVKDTVTNCFASTALFCTDGISISQLLFTQPSIWKLVNPFNEKKKSRPQEQFRFLKNNVFQLSLLQREKHIFHPSTNDNFFQELSHSQCPRVTEKYYTYKDFPLHFDDAIYVCIYFIGYYIISPIFHGCHSSNYAFKTWWKMLIFFSWHKIFSKFSYSGILFFHPLLCIFHHGLPYMCLLPFNWARSFGVIIYFCRINIYIHNLVSTPSFYY